MTFARARIKAKILDANSIHQALCRIAHQILDRNRQVEQIGLIGIGERGGLLARRLAAIVKTQEGITIAAGMLASQEDCDKAVREHKTIVLVDDLIYTGRAAHDAIAGLLNHSGVECIQLAVLVDCGNRQVPVHADYVGKSVPTASDEYIEVRLKELDNEEHVLIMEKHS